MKRMVANTWRVLGAVSAVICVVGVMLPETAAAQAAAPPPPSSPPPAANASLELGGLVDAYYDYYSTKPTGNAEFRNFDTFHNQFAFSMAELWFAKTPTPDSRVGFKLKLNFGPASSNFIHATANETGGPSYQNVQEAYASYLAPAGKGLQLDAGIFVTPAGAEVIEAKDNANYSRGLLFTNAIPYYHSGVRATYAASDKVTVMAGLVNGWNNIRENNSGKTFLGSITFKPSGSVSIIENYIVGPEQKNTNDNWRHLLDTIVTFTASPTMTVTANYDFGHEATGPSTSVSWQGLAAIVKFQLTKHVALSPRYEFFKDPDAAMTSVAQKLQEVTGTVEFKANDNLQLRIEFRRDWSDKDVFQNYDPQQLQNSMQSIGFGVMYTFGGKIQ